MSSLERSKKKLLLWKKAIAHFSLCFVMGFFTGFAPTGKSSIFPSQVAASNRTQFAAQPLEVSHRTTNVNRSWIAPTPVTKPTRSIVSKQTPKLHVKTGPQLKPRRLVIIATPTSTKLPFQAVFFRRLANTIRLVPQPLLWIVVEGQKDSTELSKILRKTGIMYRHLVSKENTNLEAELNHQRNVALKHIEHHRLSGIVHFAELSNVYDLQFFQQLRDIEVFGTWPVALLTANRKKVIIEGPVCDSSHIIGWHLRNKNNETDTITPPIHISSFAFNSSILWDPERWGRTSSVQDTSQNSIKFVKQVVLEDEAKLKGVPPENCSKIRVWRLNFHATTISNHKFLTSTQRKNRKDRK